MLARARWLAVGALTGAATTALLVLPAAAPSDNVIVTYAGNGTSDSTGDGGQATVAGVARPSGVWLDNAANVFLADSGGNRIRKVTFDGVITTVAGTGTAGFSGDGGPATAAELKGPTGVVVDGSGVIYIADTRNHRVRKVAAGIITTVAGTGDPGYTGDGQPAAAAQLKRPTGLALDGAGNLYIADTGNDAVRQVRPNGTIVTFAGTGEAGFSGNTGPATGARLDAPTGLAARGATLLISDTGNNQVRKVTGGTITAFAGTGIPGFSGDGGQATSAKLFSPTGLAADPIGNVYIVDADNARIRQVTASGIISTFAGNGNPGFSGDDGPAEEAKIHPARRVGRRQIMETSLSGVTTDASNVFYGDTLNHRVRRIFKGGGPPPALPEAPGLQSLALTGSALAILGGGFVVAQRSRRRQPAG